MMPDRLTQADPVVGYNIAKARESDVQLEFSSKLLNRYVIFQLGESTLTPF